MNLFLDTSALIKLYYREADSHTIEPLVRSGKTVTIFLSEISKPEFTSAIWKKWRMKEVTEQQAQTLLQAFQKDYSRYTFTPVESDAIITANSLLKQYGPQGLRTLDALQLSAAISLRGQANLFKSADKLLESFFVAENLPVS